MEIDMAKFYDKRLLDDSNSFRKMIEEDEKEFKRFMERFHNSEKDSSQKEAE